MNSHFQLTNSHFRVRNGKNAPLPIFPVYRSKTTNHSSICAIRTSLQAGHFKAAHLCIIKNKK